MTPEQIEKLALEAGFFVDPDSNYINDGIETAADFRKELAEFARLVAADITSERDAAREALRELVNALGKPDRSEWLNDEGYAGAMSAWARARAILEAKP